MATISGKDIYLYDKWPGIVKTNVGPPTGGFDSTKEGSGNKVIVPAYDIGEKRAYYNDSTKNPGYTIFIYLRYIEGSDNAYDLDADLSNGYGMVSHIQDCSEHTVSGETDWYLVTSDCTNSDATMGGPVAFAMCDLSGGAEITTTTTKEPEYGWFWCGGVCPCNTKTDAGLTEYTKTGGAIHTGGNVAIGKPIYCVDDGTNTVGFDLCQIDTTKDLQDYQIGRALATDA